MKKMNPLLRIHVRVSNHGIMTDTKPFKCSECGEAVSESASYCPRCGATFDDRPGTNNKTNFFLGFNPSDEPVVLLGVVAIITIFVSVIVATRFNRLFYSMSHIINYPVTIFVLLVWAGIIYHAHSGPNRYKRILPGLGIFGIGALLLVRSIYLWSRPFVPPLFQGTLLMPPEESPKFLTEIVIIEPIGALSLIMLNLEIVGMGRIITTFATGHSILVALLYIILGVVVLRMGHNFATDQSSN